MGEGAKEKKESDPPREVPSPFPDPLGPYTDPNWRDPAKPGNGHSTPAPPLDPDEIQPPAPKPPKQRDRTDDAGT